jgi:hypothetical protein
MGIVFEEVTGEITPAREAPVPDTHESSSSGHDGQGAAQAVRETLILLRERELRLRVD